MKQPDRYIGEILIQKGFCSEEDVKKALEVQAGYGQSIRIGRVLINMGAITEEQLLEALSEQFGLPYVKDVGDYEVVDVGVNPDILIASGVYPVDRDSDSVKVITNDPLNLEVFALIENVTGKPVSVVLASEEALNQLGGAFRESMVVDESRDVINVDEEVDKLKELASEAPVIKLVNSILTRAVESNATDIHFESLKGRMRVRFRIDGILTVVDHIPSNLKLAVIARLKLLSGMNIAESRLAQDGRIAIRIAGKNIDIRASSLPTQYGESFVLRILLEEQTNYELDRLGFYPDHVEMIRSIASKPNGIFLTTGPTGSGKTTTLYSILSELNSEKVKIVTVEDPIEYELAGINQVQVKPEIGRTFANALRNILRQDPDIIMVGEIRDVETAEMAIQASLTGHLVLSTLHTNSALSSITRLVDMGVEWFLLKATILGVMAQRLVRKVCPYCAEPVDLPREIVDMYHLEELAERYGIDKIKPLKGRGCSRCNNTGYRGRTVIAEIAPFDLRLQRFFDKDKNFDDIGRLGYRSMFEDGLLKVMEGKTTLDEVLRVTG